MRRYECFRRRERFLGVLVFAKLIRISIPSTLLTVLGLLAMRRVVSPIIDRVSTFVHRLYGRYPYRAVLAPMALDFPDRDPEPTILDRFPIRCQARCKPCEKPRF